MELYTSFVLFLLGVISCSAYEQLYCYGERTISGNYNQRFYESEYCSTGLWRFRIEDTTRIWLLSFPNLQSYSNTNCSIEAATGDSVPCDKTLVYSNFSISWKSRQLRVRFDLTNLIIFKIETENEDSSLLIYNLKESNLHREKVPEKFPWSRNGMAYKTPEDRVDDDEVTSDSDYDEYTRKKRQISETSYSDVQHLPGLKIRNPETFKEKSIKGLQLAQFEEGLGGTVRYNNRSIYPVSPFPSCSAEDLDKCMWSHEGIQKVLDPLSFPRKDTFFLMKYKDNIFRSLKKGLLVNKICLYIEYKVVRSMPTLLHVFHSPSSVLEKKILIGEKTLSKVGGWVTERVTFDIASPISLDGLSLALSFRPKEDFYLRKIQGCDPYNLVDMYTLENQTRYKLIWNFEKSSDLVNSSECLNGGKADPNQNGKCVCPVGFSGIKCQIGCGPNSFGPDCNGQCSTSEDGDCSGRIFCKKNMGCHCSTGFHGDKCTTKCLPGRYGPSCLLNCGHCENGQPCDIYTGVCLAGCVPGYISPLCQQESAYLETAPEVSNITFTTAYVQIPLSQGILGVGTPKYYKLQIRDLNGDASWIVKSVGLADKMQDKEVYLRDLEPGHSYKVRTLIITEEGYINDNKGVVPTKRILTNCTDMDLVLEPVMKTDGLYLYWKDSSDNPNKCSFPNFNVGYNKDGYWNFNVVKNTWHYYIGRPSPKTTVLMFVRNIHTYRDRVFVTSFRIPELETHVKELAVDEVTDSSVRLSWKQTRTSVIIKYKCEELVTCMDQNSCSDEGSFETEEDSIIIRNLNPSSRYQIFITLSSSKDIVKTAIITKSRVPWSAPVLRELHVTNSSFDVSWKKPENCLLYNGLLTGYFYKIENEGGDEISSGEIFESQLYIDGLSSSSIYKIKIYLTNEAGYNTSLPLVVEAFTKSSTPSNVVDLTVYKKSRTSVGLRWQAPRHISGLLHEFTVEVEDRVLRHPPTPCPSWPHMYCYTVTGLTPETTYNFSVSARNNKIEEDGPKSYVVAETVEKGPDPPEQLRVSNLTQNSFMVDWAPPSFSNGILRSFLLKIEQTESFRPSGCCSPYPKMEMAVTEELPRYSTKVEGLRAGATYALSLMGETVWIGNPATTSVSTRPPAVDLVPPPKVSIRGFDGSVKWKFIPNQQPDEFHSLYKGYFLLITPGRNLSEDDDFPKTVSINDKDLKQQIDDVLENRPYYVAYKQDKENEDSEIVLGRMSNEEYKVATWGTPIDPPLNPGFPYQIAMVQIFQYCGLYSVSVQFSDTFQILQFSDTFQILQFSDTFQI